MDTLRFDWTNISLIGLFLSTMTQQKPPQRFFLLTTHSFDKENHFEIHLHGVSESRKPISIIIDNYKPLFFIARSTPQNLTTLAYQRKGLPLQTMDGVDVDCLYFSTNGHYQQCRLDLKEKGIATFESDIYPTERFLMERMVAGGFTLTGTPARKGSQVLYKNPKIRGSDFHGSLEVLSFDIEINTSSQTLYSIASFGKNKKVFMIGTGREDQTLLFCKDESALITNFLQHLKEEDPDILIGWNVINFDCVFLQRRCEILGIPFEIGRDKGTLVRKRTDSTHQHRIAVPGRVVLDVPVMLRANNYSFDRFSLNFVAHQMLGKGKLIEESGREKIEKIDQLFREDKEALARYNLEDAILTKEIFDKTNLLANAIERSKRSGHLLDQLGRSVAAFDYLYLPRLHRKGYIAIDKEDVPHFTGTLTGGFVLEPKPGIYENVLMLDFKSLYPTIIMTFCIDPLAAKRTDAPCITGPTKASFSKENALLPKIIFDLMQARKEAKSTGNEPLSYAIKILMNSFYGVLGSPGCRFFSPTLAQTITETGQYILKSTKSFIEQETPHYVLYGDTDSLFVVIGPGKENKALTIGKEIVDKVNNWLQNHISEAFSADSALELEFDEHFRYFFMPAIRGSTQGSKKRYCGAVEQEGEIQLIFKGLEAARSDWTQLAREFQYTLYKLIFQNQPFESFIITTVNKVKQGHFDKSLIYRKQLRKPLNEYTTHKPPHVQAAMHLTKPGSVIRYYITIDGPQPVEKVTAPLDYNHYIESQLKPIADSILEWRSSDFDTIVSGQQDLFS